MLPNGTRWAVESGENLWATSTFARPRQVDAHAVEGDYFTIKKYDLSSGRVFTPQETELGAPVVVIGDEVAKFFFPGLNALGRELRVGGLPYQVIGVIDSFNQSRMIASNAFNLSAVTIVAIIFVLITIPQARFVDRLLERDQARMRAGS